MPICWLVGWLSICYLIKLFPLGKHFSKGILTDERLRVESVENGCGARGWLAGLGAWAWSVAVVHLINIV